MSKRVEVRAGDEFRIAPVGNVWQFRDGRRQCLICHGVLRGGSEWLESFADTWPTMPLAAARAWIESLGGEWAEVAEEKPAKVVAHVSEIGAVYLSIEGSEEFKASEEANFRRITIAGVT